MMMMGVMMRIRSMTLPTPRTQLTRIQILNMNLFTISILLKDNHAESFLNLSHYLIPLHILMH
jgi:hypothetical protein